MLVVLDFMLEAIVTHIRDDLNSTTDDYECLWIEIHAKCHRNIICSVIYRHPNGNFDNFSNYLTASMDKISNEKNMAP